MHFLRSLLGLAALAVGVAGCSLALDFDPEGQPCDPRGQCLAGYTCQLGTCVAASPDAGTRLPDGGTGGQGLCADGTEGCAPPSEPH